MSLIRINKVSHVFNKTVPITRYRIGRHIEIRRPDSTFTMTTSIFDIFNDKIKKVESSSRLVSLEPACLSNLRIHTLARLHQL
jgi:hypothetical protein